ncbi:unnamed protein product [Gordionus sp. m RMFG-2023]
MSTIIATPFHVPQLEPISHNQIFLNEAKATYAQLSTQLLPLISIANSVLHTQENLNFPNSHLITQPYSFKHEIRTVKSEEIGSINRWRKEEFGYRAHESYMQYIHEMDPSGWFVAVDTDNNIIGNIFGMNLNEDLAFGGLYAVKKPYRCHGIGGKLWNTRLLHIGNRNMGIDSVHTRVEANKKAGMKVSFRLSRYYGRLTMESLTCFINAVNNGSDSKCQYIIINAAQPEPEMQSILDKLIYYDTEINKGCCRKLFLDKTILTKDTITCVALEKNVDSTSIGQVIGYGILRPRFEGLTIGPLYADTPNVANGIFAKLFSGLLSNFMAYQSPATENCSNLSPLFDMVVLESEPNDPYLKNDNTSEYTLLNETGEENNLARAKCVKDLLNTLSLKRECILYRMYTKEDIKLPLAKVYAITSSEAFLL